MRPDAAAAHVLVVVKGTVRTFEEVTVLPEPLSEEQPKNVAGKAQASGKAPPKGLGKDGSKREAGSNVGKGPGKAPAKGKTTPQGNVVERTRGLFEVGLVLADVGALVSGRSSGLGVQAVEEAAVLRLPWTALRVACNADHALEPAPGGGGLPGGPGPHCEPHPGRASKRQGRRRRATGRGAVPRLLGGAAHAGRAPGALAGRELPRHQHRGLGAAALAAVPDAEHSRVSWSLRLCPPSDWVLLNPHASQPSQPTSDSSPQPLRAG